MALNAAELQITITADASQAEATVNRVEGMISGVLVGHQIADFGEGVLDFMGDVISVGATFEEQMVFIDRIIGGTISHLEELKQKAIDADINTMFNALEVTQGMEMLARAGFDALQIIGTPGGQDGLIDAMLFFAAATRTEMGSAGRSFAAAARIFQNSGISMIELSDLMTAAILRSGRTADQFMTAFQYVGSISQQFGTTPEDISTIIALMLQLGVRSLSTGTSLRSFYSAAASKRGDIEALGVSLFTVNDAGQEILRTLPDIIQQFHRLSETMSPSEFYALLEDTFGKPAASGLMTLFTTGAEHLPAFQKSMDDVSDSAGIMEARMNTLKGSLEKFKATWLGLKKVMGDSISEWVKPLVDHATKLVDTLQNAPHIVHQIISAMLLFVGVLTMVTGKLIILRALGGSKMVSAVFTQMGGSIGMLLSPIRMLFAPLTLITRALWAVLLPVRILAGPLAVLVKPLTMLLRFIPFVRLGLLGIALAAAAIKTNFGGITDWIMGLGDKWKEFKERLHEGLAFNRESHQLKKGLASTTEVMRTGFRNIAMNALAALRDMTGLDFLDEFDEIFGKFSRIGDGINIVTDNLSRLSEVIKKHGIGEGLSQIFGGTIGDNILEGLGVIISGITKGIGEIVQQIETGNPQIDSALHNFGGSFQNFGAAIERALHGDWSGAWDRFKKAVRLSARGGVQIFEVGVQIGGWAIETAVDLWDELKGFVYGATGGQTSYGPGTGALNPGRENIPIETVAIQVKDWTITAWNGSLAQSLFGKFIDILSGDITFSPAQMQKAEGLGNTMGSKVGEFVAKGLKLALESAFDALGGGGGGTEQIYDPISGKVRDMHQYQPFKFEDLINSFLDGFFGGFEEAGEEVFAPWRAKIRTWWTQTWSDFLDLFAMPGTTAGASMDPASPMFQGERKFDFMSIIKGILKIDEFTFEALGLPDYGAQFNNWLGAQFSTIESFLTDNRGFQAAALLAKGDFLGAWNALFGGEAAVSAYPDPRSDVPNMFPTHKRNPWDPQDSMHPEDQENIPEAIPVEPPGARMRQMFAQRYSKGALNPATNIASLVTTSMAPVPGIIQGKLSEAGSKLTTFSSRAPGQLAAFGPAVQRMAQGAMERFSGAVNTGMGIAARAAFVGAQLVASNARIPDLWSHGFNVGYNLGAGMASGMEAALGLVAAARNSLNQTAQGSSPTSKTPAFQPTSATSVQPAASAGVVQQTNHITMDLQSVEELVRAGAFVTNLSRNRQIKLGNT